jgi:hypothetical protein
MNKRKSLRGIAIALIGLMVTILACGPGPAGETGPSVTITSPASGTSVAVGEEVQIVSTVAADAGVDRVELSVNGQVVRTDTPPEGNPTTFSVAQPWTPVAEGQVNVAVTAYDTEGTASEPATLTLEVGTAVGEEPTEEPTDEPGPSPTPEEDVEGPGGCSLNAAYVADVTVPDDTEMDPNESFNKTWRLRNSGTCNWNADYSLVFVGGDQMDAPASISVPATAAGATVDVTVPMTAPSDPGSYRSNWRMQSDEGTVFGSQVYVRIVVPEPATATPTEEPTEEPTAEPEAPTNLAVDIEPDGSVRFTWNDAVGEARYEYEYDYVAGGLGAAVADTLPADTTSYDGGTVGCGGEGTFIIIAIDEDDQEIGRDSIDFETDPCADFTASYQGVHQCGAYPNYATFLINNVGSEAFEWMTLHIEDVDNDVDLYGPANQGAPFLPSDNACPPGFEAIQSGEALYIAGNIGDPLPGATAQAHIRLCTEEGGGGECVEKTVNFITPVSAGASFSANYVGVHQCGSLPNYATFRVVNTGSEDFQWMDLYIEDLDHSTSLYGPASNSTPFVSTSGGCPPGAGTLPSGDTMYIAANIGDPPGGSSARAHITLCTQESSGGTCVEELVDFTTP